ncbi:NifU family protein [Fulvivirga sedimenti]|uniref:NifU family protein n=1 Tax=Fulvivirga sedimenti TaxID=2879465 RepID=A0A9X1KY50_9BACT|nr:NifU family protein [Fulvivirga sedimenti]MCA6074882.1 NifU family protein [Fulvivirga sedimenti]MCA6076059.1 NifU family protein [Fulvivirga sedimenti]MCA6077187.1 NifU family protein [Fulvivirga sedimenti]
MKKDELVKRIDQALDNIRPYLETDGGNVQILELTDDMVVRLELLGACGNCPMSTMTLKAGVEEAIKKAVPEVISVEAINITKPGDPHAKLPDNML